MTAEPPVSTGAVHVKFTVRSPGVPATLEGAPATVRGVTPPEVASLPTPAAFFAATLNV